MCSSPDSNKLYMVTMLHGLPCLLTILAEMASLDIICTRPISTITMEEAMMSKITTMALSLDGLVVFLLDQGLGKITRMKLPTGNCRSFGRDLSCKYKVRVNQSPSRSLKFTVNLH